jgi:hypothetical protein
MGYGHCPFGAMPKIADRILLMASKLLNRQQDNQQSAVPRGGGNTRPRGDQRGGSYRGGRGGQNRLQEYYDRQEYDTVIRTEAAGMTPHTLTVGGATAAATETIGPGPTSKPAILFFCSSQGLCIYIY